MKILNAKNVSMASLGLAGIALLTGCGNGADEATGVPASSATTSSQNRPVVEHKPNGGVSFSAPEPAPTRPFRRDTGAKPTVHGTANPEYG